MVTHNLSCGLQIIKIFTNRFNGFWKEFKGKHISTLSDKQYDPPSKGDPLWWVALLFHKEAL